MSSGSSSTSRWSSLSQTTKGMCAIACWRPSVSTRKNTSRPPATVATWSATSRMDLARAHDYAARIDPAEAALGKRSAEARRGPAVLAFFSIELDAARTLAEEWVMLARQSGDAYQLTNALIL